jgi:hypothetical protein
MRSDPLCPQCMEDGWLVGRDAKGRELFACRTPTCDVVEYDAEVIRRREGLAYEPSGIVAPTGRRRRVPNRRVPNLPIRRSATSVGPPLIPGQEERAGTWPSGWRGRVEAAGP